MQRSKRMATAAARVGEVIDIAVPQRGVIGKRSGVAVHTRISVHPWNDARWNRIRVLCPKLLVLLSTLGVVTPVAVKQQHDEISGVDEAGGTAPSVPGRDMKLKRKNGVVVRGKRRIPRRQAKGDADNDITEVIDVARIAPEPRDKKSAADCLGRSSPDKAGGVGFEVVLLLVGDAEDEIADGECGDAGCDGDVVEGGGGSDGRLFA